MYIVNVYLLFCACRTVLVETVLMISVKCDVAPPTQQSEGILLEHAGLLFMPISP